LLLWKQERDFALIWPKITLDGFQAECPGCVVMPTFDLESNGHAQLGN